MNSYPEKFSNRKTVLCHDWLTGMRGGEKVLEILCDWFPEAPVCTLIYKPGAVSSRISTHSIITSPLQRVPGIFNNYRFFLPFFPAAIKSIVTPPSDLIISTSHCVAKGLRKSSAATRHLCYCFTPMRYAWLFHAEYIGRNPVKQLLAAPVLARMRRWDKANSANVDLFVAISDHVRKRIKEFYSRDAEIVYPPVDTDRFTPAEKSSDDFDLIVSALVPYKKVDLAVRAYSKLGTTLKVAGTGTEMDRLKSIASGNIQFLGWQSDDQIRELYRNCRTLIFPGEEDFGIVPVEAQSCGKPVVAFRKGGTLESIIDNETGIFFNEQTPECIEEAVFRCASMHWDKDAIRANALRFSIPSFIEGLALCMDKVK